MKGQTYVIVAIIFVIIVSIFAVTNVESVEVNYLFWKRNSPLILIILFSVLMGGLITAAAGSVKIFRLQRTNRQLNHENDHMKTVLKKHDLLQETSDEHDTSPNQQKEEK